MFQAKNEEQKERFNLGGGPKGYGNPNDRRLRKLERDVVLPKMMKEEAQKRCSETMSLFLNCAKSAGLLVTFKCRDENYANNLCLESWYQNPAFVKDMTEKYVERRRHFRETGEPVEKYERVKKRGPH